MMLKKKAMLTKLNPKSIILPVALVVFWYLITKFGHIPKYLIPSPGYLMLVLTDFIFGNLNLTPYSGMFLSNACVSCERVLCGFLLAVSLGLFFGFLTARIKLFREIVDPFIHLIRSVPGIGWLPVAMVWFGVGEKKTLFLISLAAFFPIYVNTVQGVENVPPLYIRAGKMLGAKKWSLVSEVVLPAAMPSIFSGMRLGLGVSWAYLVLGELTGVSYGLGAVMMDARAMGNVEVVIVSMICIAVIGKISDMILVFVFKRFQPRIGGA